MADSRTRITERLLLALVAAALVACGGSGGGGNDVDPGGTNGASPMFEDIEPVRYPMGAVTPANSGSPYAGVLRDCTFSNDRTEPCTLQRLPLLGQVDTDPGIEDVMDRVITSRAWMAHNFRAALERMPDDLYLLFRSVTAIVISNDVRPSFYWTATGAIYLDAEYVWLEPEERAIIPDDPDFRSDFGRDLQFVMPTRYVKDNSPAIEFIPRGEERPRDIDDIVVNLARLLYHELAHANDYFPPARHASLGTGPVNRAVQRPLISDDLAERHPLMSDMLHGLARVRFHGDEPTEAQKAITPAQVADEFEPDGATIFYNYSTEREDLAMLFEILMMRFHFDVEMDTAVTNNPENPTSGHDFIVEWGQRNRLGDVNVKERARYTASRLLPEVNLDGYIDDLPAPVMMRSGESWASNIHLDEDGDPGALTDRRPFDPNPVRDLPPYH